MRNQVTSDRKPTSFDIAHLAGVSQPTVSRALRNSPLVNKKTREKIQKIALDLNYSVDKNAANLRLKQSKTLALLIFEDATSDDSSINPFFLAMLGSITRSAAAVGYDLLVSFQKLHEDWHNEYEVAHRADGLILLGYGDFLNYVEKLESLERNHASFIIWGPLVEGQPGCSIGCDNKHGGYIATKHLIDLGHKSIAFIGEASERYPEILDRYQGHCEALQEAGLDIKQELMVSADNQESSGAAAIESLLQKGAEFTAIFTATDLMAIGAINYLNERGYSVPGDIAVVGFDDIPAASYISPPLTTVHQNTQESGRYLVDKLVELISGAEVKSQLITPHLVVRGTCSDSS